jgi:hypothetical protein
MCCLSDEFISSTHCTNHMTALANRTWTILGEEFEYDELKDIANHGADTGVHGFTYSSDLHDMYEEYTDVIDDHINELGYTMAEVFEERGFDTLQQYKEWACWVYLESMALVITDY